MVPTQRREYNTSLKKVHILSAIQVIEQKYRFWLFEESLLPQQTNREQTIKKEITAENVHICEIWRHSQCTVWIKAQRQSAMCTHWGWYFVSIHSAKCSCKTDYYTCKHGYETDWGQAGYTRKILIHITFTCSMSKSLRERKMVNC